MDIRIEKMDRFFSVVEWEKKWVMLIVFKICLFFGFLIDFEIFDDFGQLLWVWRIFRITYTFLQSLKKNQKTKNLKKNCKIFQKNFFLQVFKTASRIVSIHSSYAPPSIPYIIFFFLIFFTPSAHPLLFNFNASIHCPCLSPSLILHNSEQGKSV